MSGLLSLASFQALIAIEVALLASLNERLSSIAEIGWSPTKAHDRPLNNLHQTIRKDDVLLRVIGLHVVVRVLEEELQALDDISETPLALIQCFNDISTLANCKNEVLKYGQFDLVQDREYARLAVEESID